MKTIVISSVVLVLAMVGMANAGLYEFQPYPADLYDLDHYKSYTWGIDFTVPPGEQIVEAFLMFNNIYDWTVEEGDHLYIHLLDNPQSGVWVHHDGQGGGDQFSGQGVLVDDWSDPAGGSSSASPLVYQFSTVPGSQSGTTLLDDLRAYAMTTEAGKANFGFGIDPDCHYYNCGIKLVIETAAYPCGPCEGKVTQLTLQYLGTDEAHVTVIQKKDDEVVFEGLVQPGGVFTFVGKDKHGTLGTEISIYVNGSLNTKIHTSCSQPIGPGLIRGAFKVIEGYSLNGGLLCSVEEPPEPPCGECEGKVTQLTLRYLGTEEAVIGVIQKRVEEPIFAQVVQPGGVFTLNGKDKHGTLGTEISIYVNDYLNTKIHTSCSQPIGPGMVRGFFEVVEGYSLKGGLLCPVEEPPCGECEGKVTQLTLRYLGEDAYVTVMQKKVDTPVFEGLVEKDNDFTFNGTDKNGTLGTEISIYVNGQLNTNIHTSCSQPIGPGLVSGDFEVVEGYSLKGGLLCPTHIDDDG